jgi:hypothetical protein
MTTSVDTIKLARIGPRDIWLWEGRYMDGSRPASKAGIAPSRRDHMKYMITIVSE